MKIIGITGGVGSGKSAAAMILRDHFNAEVFFTDESARALYEKGKKGYDRIVGIFKDEVLDKDGNIDRAKLAGLLFNDQKMLDKVNSLIHPLVWDEAVGFIEDGRKSGAKLLVIESAILIEAGYRKLCDEVWYVKADEEVRRERLKRDRNYSDERIERVFANQAQDGQYLENCDKIIDNSKGFDELLEEVSRALK